MHYTYLVFSFFEGSRIKLEEESEIFVKHANLMKGVMDPRSTTGEYPPRQTSVKDYYIDKYPVTNADFMQVHPDL